MQGRCTTVHLPCIWKFLPSYQGDRWSIHRRYQGDTRVIPEWYQGDTRRSPAVHLCIVLLLSSHLKVEHLPCIWKFLPSYQGDRWSIHRRYQGDTRVIPEWYQGDTRRSPAVHLCIVLLLRFGIFWSQMFVKCLIWCHMLKIWWKIWVKSARKIGTTKFRFFV